MNTVNQTILVIGYGNSLRGDDGVGPHIASHVATWKIPHVEAIAVQQLTPDLAERLIEVDLVIFVDANLTHTKTVQVCPITISDSGMVTGHWCEPSILLAITQALYGHHPKAWWVTVPGSNFDLGETFSALIQQEINVALEAIHHLIQTARTTLYMKLE
ncbi:hydrogenase maturation protease [Oscillatoria sp. FACHB-1407]|uniref:hydrogenase maturation protease n=1 Tax=Oscillatoria sp. FACHB-1407 TaxID=2692847 RepID=UPI0018EF421C|nr:hydrogenase maturation protease [Oscillatoria sp. FACHB-1407]